MSVRLTGASHHNTVLPAAPNPLFSDHSGAHPVGLAQLLIALKQGTFAPRGAFHVIWCFGG
jgi:hypothetical protein